MDWGPIVLLGVILWLVLRLFFPHAPRGSGRSNLGNDDGAGEEEKGAARHRVDDLCAALTGDPRHDRLLQNRILALGSGILPLVLEAHAEVLRGPDGPRPQVMARLEETVADFGLSAVPVVTAALGRMNATSPPALSLLRILSRLGEGGVAPTLRQGFAQPQLAPYLPRWRLASVTRNPAGVLTQVLRDRPAASRSDDLDTLAGLIAAHPRVQTELWRRWADAPEGRMALLSFQSAWLPLAEPSLVAAGLLDAHDGVRLAAARLAGLLPAHELLAPLAGLATSDPRTEIREAAIRALSQDASAVAREALTAALCDHEPEVAAAARHALRSLVPHVPRATPGVGAPELTSSHAAVPAGTEADGLEALLDAADRADVDTLLQGLEAPSDGERRLAAELLAEFVRTDPRAKERLFRAVEARDYAVAAAAILALARAGEPQTPELLARQIRDPTPPEVRLTLQEAARVLGPASAVPLARRLRAEGGGRLDALLAVLRAVPYAGAVAPLLRALEATHGTRAAGQIAATLTAGGPEIRQALDAGQQQPGRGLLTPALARLAAYATPDDLPVLFDMLDQHPPLRSIILGLIEAQGDPAREPLRARIARGGDDAALLALEQRLAVLDACLAVRETA